MTVSQTPLEIVASLCLFSSIKVLHIEMFVNVEDFEGHYDDPRAQPTHPLLLSTDNPYFPSKLRVSSIEVPNPSHVPFFLALIAKTASVEAITDVDVARDTNEQIRALGSFLRVVRPRIKKITADIVALSHFTISGALLTLLDLPCYFFFQYNTTDLASSGNLQAFNFSACPALTHLILQMDLFPHRKDLNIVSFTAARMFLLAAPTTVQNYIGYLNRWNHLVLERSGWLRLHQRKYSFRVHTLSVYNQTERRGSQALYPMVPCHRKSLRQSSSRGWIRSCGVSYWSWMPRVSCPLNIFRILGTKLNTQSSGDDALRSIINED